MGDFLNDSNDISLNIENLSENERFVLSRCDHTLLAVTATKEQILQTVRQGIAYKTASVCIPPCYVAEAARCARGRVKICTVIGFPNGYSSSEVKVFETAEAVKSGADEIDMVINVGELKAKNYEYVLGEINAVKKACGEKVLKVIIETCLLSEEEKIAACNIVSRSNADYIKTSTGFAGGGATLEDVRLLREHCDKKIKVKAAGGVSGLESALQFLAAGADRIGTSRVVKEVELLKRQN